MLLDGSDCIRIRFTKSVQEVFVSCKPIYIMGTDSNFYLLV